MNNPGPNQVDFPMQIAASTPEDIYLITLGLAILKDQISTTKSILLPAGRLRRLNDPKWGQYVLINDIFVDTGSWLGWLSLFDTSGGPTWAYSFELESYFFFPNPPQQIDSGIWIYVPLSGS